jgi:hypothetical protein
VSALQKPDATRVAGLYAWNQLKRRVKKGERGIRILAPVIGIKRKKDEEAEKDIRTQNHGVLVGFRSAYVFDVSQTDGEELPELSTKVSGDVGERRERLVEFVIAQGIQLEFKESIAPALGVSYGGKISLLPGQSTAEEFSTLVHELSHEMLHKADRRTATTKTVRETEAEAIAFVVGKTIGLDTGRASADSAACACSTSTTCQEPAWFRLFRAQLNLARKCAPTDGRVTTGYPVKGTHTTQPASPKAETQPMFPCPVCTRWLPSSNAGCSEPTRDR